MMKLIFALLYQEKHIHLPGFNTQAGIMIGGYMVSVVNDYADSLTQFVQTDDSVTKSVDLYPGQAQCKAHQGHSIWHEVSSNGLLDLVYLCDYVFYLTKEYYVPNPEHGILF